MTVTTTTARVEVLKGLRGDELDGVFRAATVGDVPAGVGRGVALVAAGTRWGRRIARVVGLVWRGKVFAPERGQLDNLLTPWSRRAITAAVYPGDSRLDGRPCIVLDYSTTSIVARWIRDEIHEITPGQFLGIVFLGRYRLPVRFTLRFLRSRRRVQRDVDAGQRLADRTSDFGRFRRGFEPALSSRRPRPNREGDACQLEAAGRVGPEADSAILERLGRSAASTSLDSDIA